MRAAGSVVLPLAMAMSLAVTPVPSLVQAQEGISDGENLVLNGTVMVPGTREPVEGATVVLREGSMAAMSLQDLFQGARSERRATTDANGRFAFSGMTPGLHELAVEYPGDRGDRQETDSGNIAGFRVRRPGKTIELTSGAPPPDVELWMIQSGTVSGRVVDLDGNPVAGACVDLLQRRWSPQGEEVLAGPRLRLNSSCETDGDGRFRILAPVGTYLVRVRTLEPGAYNTAAFRYYPGRIDPSAAIPVTVAADPEVSGIEIRIDDVPLYRARFKVVLPEYLPGVPEPTATYLEDFGGAPAAWIRSVVGRASSLQSTDLVAIEALGEGVYATPALPSGEYEMRVGYPNEVKNHLRNEFEVDWPAHDPIGTIRFTLDDEDVDLGSIPPMPRFDVSGSVLLRSALAGPELDFAMLPEFMFMNESYVVASVPLTATAEPDGSFIVDNLYPGLFSMHFQVDLVPDGWYVASATSRGRNILAEGLLVEGAPAPIDIVLAGDGGRIEGQVRDRDGDAVPDARLLLIPPLNRRGPMLGFPTVVADYAGRFSLGRIPPGEYTLLALDESGYPESNSYWRSPAFLAEYEARGESISMNPGARMILNPEAVRFEF